MPEPDLWARTCYPNLALLINGFFFLPQTHSVGLCKPYPTKSNLGLIRGPNRGPIKKQSKNANPRPAMSPISLLGTALTTTTKKKKINYNELALNITQTLT